MMGNLSFEPLISSMSLIHPPWESTVLAERPISLTPRLVNSGSSLANAPSSLRAVSHRLYAPSKERRKGSAGWSLVEQDGKPTSCAHWGVIFRMAEKHNPLVADELMEVDWPVGSIGFEVGGSRPETEATMSLSSAACDRRGGAGEAHRGASSVDIACDGGELDGWFRLGGLI